MKKYAIIGLNGDYAVIERTNFENMVIKGELKRKDAQELCARLNKGYAFDGWTPLFFLDRKLVLV